MMTAKVTSKGQITIPKKIREALGLRIHDRVVFMPMEDGGVLLTTETRGVDALFGLLGHRKPTDPIPVEEMEQAITRRRRAHAQR